jgi:2-polyprenyl-3-methyl-5-hydroxy-6-metoxy-1,4-benzoquinol methylase
MDGSKTYDPTEEATTWGLAQEDLRERLALGFRSGDPAEDARRFYKSTIFSETIRIFARLGKPAGNKYRILDVGCGNGIACYAFGRFGYDCTGIDVSEGRVAGLQGARSIIGLDGAQFRVLNADMQTLSLSGEYDVIFMQQALHHSPDPVTTVRTLSRMLSKGGIFCAIREHVVLTKSQLRQFLAEHPFQHITKDEHAYNLSTYRAAFRQAGLTKRAELYPFDSPINFYPGSYDSLLERLSRKTGIDLMRRPAWKKVILRLLAYKHQLRGEQLYSFFYEKTA